MKKIKLTLSAMALASMCIAQSQWRIAGNSNTDSTNLIGTTNAQPLIVKTNDVKRVLFDANGNIAFYGYTVFNKGIKADSMRITKYLAADSIHARIIRVGKNSLVMGGVFGPGGNDNLQSTQGVINIGNTGTFANINLSIGANFIGPFNPTRAKLFVNGKTGLNITNPLSTLGIFGNTAIGSSFSSLNAPTDGLIVEGFTGIATSAPVRQLELYTTSLGPQFRITRFLGTHFTDISTTTNGDLTLFPTNTTLAGNAQQRYVGIQTNTPGNSLEINSQAPNTNQSFAGLRFTDLNSTSPALPSNGMVLSLDANGDVVWRLDGSGGGGGVLAQNGLNNTIQLLNLTGKDELGGNLIRPTDVTMQDLLAAKQNMCFNGAGQFGVTDFTVAALFEANASNFTSEFKSGIFTKDKYDRGLWVHNIWTSPVLDVYGTYSQIEADGVRVTGVKGTAQGNASLLVGTQGTAASKTPLASITYGVLSGAAFGLNNYAFNGIAQGTAANEGLNNVGIQAEGWFGSSKAIGGYFIAKSSTVRNIGVLAEVQNIPNVASEHFGIRALADGAGNPTNSTLNIAIVGFAGYDVKGKTQIGVAGVIDNSNLSVFPGARIGVYGRNIATGFAGFF